MAKQTVQTPVVYMLGSCLYAPTLAILKAMTSKYYGDGTLVLLGGGTAEFDQSPCGWYKYDSDYESAGDDDDTIVPTDNATGTGCWRRVGDDTNPAS